MKAYIQLLRPKQSVKNLLVLFPIVFSGRLLEGELLRRSLWAALAFCGAAGAVYIFNDLRDRERDRRHPTKCRRPIASGAVSVPGAAAEGAVLAALTMGAFRLGHLPAESGGCLLLYVLLNLGYSLGLKNVPILDVARSCLKIGNVPNGERFFRQTRRFDAAILCVLQGKSTQYGGKRSAVWAC